MNYLTNCAPTDVSRTFAVMWISILYLLNMICTGSTLSITSSSCGDKIDMDYHKKIDVTHSGRNVLDENPCSVEFTKTSYKQYLCIYGDEIQLDCDTSLEYHEGFVKNYIPPEVKMSCNNKVIGEWCPSQYQDNVFIVIRKSSHDAYENIKLRVYLKDVPEDDDYSESDISTTLALILVPLSFVFLCICLGVIIQPKCKKARTSRPQIAYQTTSGAVNINAGQMYNSAHPASSFNQPNPQTYPNVQPSGPYNVYPMQTAYPMQQGTAPVNQTMYPQQGNPGQNYPSAPPMNVDALPPSYESLLREKH